jgi:hypothetical protein
MKEKRERDQASVEEFNGRTMRSHVIIETFLEVHC